MKIVDLLIERSLTESKRLKTAVKTANQVAFDVGALAFELAKLALGMGKLAKMVDTHNKLLEQHGQVIAHLVQNNNAIIKEVSQSAIDTSMPKKKSAHDNKPN